MSENKRVPNRLIDENSSYLLQHAYNPVDWYPWGEEAFSRAKAEDKPIFLSIGYSACHWCHVMEQESFDDPETAELLNRHFICIKVDKEERPDIDSVYMAVCQVFTGQGGWPCTVLTTSDQRPFFAGTYFPKEKKYNTLGLMQLLPLAADSWKNRREELEATADQVVQILKSQENPKPSGKGSSTPYSLEDSSENPTENQAKDSWEHQSEELSATPSKETPLETLGGLSRLKSREYDRLIALARRELEENFDETWGGFGREPKFPLPHNLLFLLGLYQSSGGRDKKALEMAEKTLLAMYKGGIFDQVGGGFCRYATDQKWLVPHFEKMLYDNALLIMAYVEGFRITHRECFRQAAERTAEYVLGEMTSPEGGFYTAQDADSEGEEGKYYTFVPSELISVLGEEEGELFCGHYSITSRGNFEGRSIPNLLGGGSVHTVNAETGEHVMEGIRQRVFEYRRQRASLHRDDKILPSWNGLMIGAMAKAYQVLGSRRYLNAAEKAFQFAEDQLTVQIHGIKEKVGPGFSGVSRRLCASWRQGKRKGTGFLDDYAFLGFAALCLHQASGKVTYLQKALDYTVDMTQLFFDWGQGGFYLIGRDQEQLIVRPKETYDGALPSGNSVAAYNLVSLAQKLSGSDGDLLRATEKQLNYINEKVAEHPSGSCFAMLAFLEAGACVYANSDEEAGTEG